MIQNLLARVSLVLVALTLAACSSRGPTSPEGHVPPSAAVTQPRALPQLTPHAIGPSIRREASLWTPVPWSDLPGFDHDELGMAWEAWLKSCTRPLPGWASTCAEVGQLRLADDAVRRAWMRQHLQPYLVRNHDGRDVGMLTAYYEPVLRARRIRGAGFEVPLYAMPMGYSGQNAWYSRQQIESGHPAASAALRGREIAWLESPVDAMVLHIQGSGRLILQEPSGEIHQVRLAYAGTNNQKYASVGRWLLDRRLVRDATWPGIKAWVDANPARVQEMLWSNPRYVFFREEMMLPQDTHEGPRGAQGVALTPGRSIAVDRRSIPYGTPVWLMTAGPTLNEQRLVLAQDTGSAIIGAVRADYFAGWGEQAGDMAGRVKQDLYLWTLWPKGVALP